MNEKSWKKFNVDKKIHSCPTQFAFVVSERVCEFQKTNTDDNQSKCTLNVWLPIGGAAFAHRRIRESREQRERFEADALRRVKVGDATVGVRQLRDGSG